MIASYYFLPPTNMQLISALWSIASLTVESFTQLYKAP